MGDVGVIVAVVVQIESVDIEVEIVGVGAPIQEMGMSVYCKMTRWETGSLVGMEVI